MRRSLSLPPISGLVVLVALAGGLGSGGGGGKPAPSNPSWQTLSNQAPTAPASAPPAVMGRGPTAVMANVAGWNAPTYQPTNRTMSLAVAPDGERVALTWLHNAGGGPPSDGEPSTFATIGLLGNPASFSVPVLIGVAPFQVGPFTLTRFRRYNSAHNAPFVYATTQGGFVSLSLPMNANGYVAQRSPTGYSYVESDAPPGGTAWSPPVLSPVADTSAGSSLSEISGGVTADGSAHLVGQGHLGRCQGALAYQRRRAGQSAWETATLVQAYRPGGLTYMLEGAMAIARDARGREALHVAYSWNKQGTVPTYGLSYMTSLDGGRNWLDVRGRGLSLPLRFGQNEAPATIVPAALTQGGYGGASPGVHGLSVAATPEGWPLIVRSTYLPSDANRTQTQLSTYVDGRWVSAPVGWPVFWNHGGTGVAYNAATGNVNVLVLDPGNPKRKGQVVRYTQSLAAVRKGQSAWKRQVVAEAPNRSSYASSLEVAVVPGRKFVFTFEPDYRNPGRVSPVLGQAALQ